MKLINIKTVILVSVLVILTVITVTTGYFLGVRDEKNKYQQTLVKLWGPFYKDTHFGLVLHGNLAEKGKIWKIQNQGDTISVSVLATQQAFRINSLNGNDYKNWKKIPVDEVSVGDEVFIEGYYHPTVGNNVLAATVFVKNKAN